MNQFEDQLRQTLSRKQPSADFTEKVLLKTTPRNRLWRWQAIAALAACLAGVGIYETYRYQQGQFAKQQLLLALRHNRFRGVVFNNTFSVKSADGCFLDSVCRN